MNNLNDIRSKKKVNEWEAKICENICLDFD